MDQAASAAPRHALQYDGRISELYRIFLVNVLLTIITLGIFRFWAITRYRRYLWAHMRFQNERFEYAGRGLELFLGMLMAIGILIGMSIAAAFLAFICRLIHPALAVVPTFGVYVFIFVLMGAARFSAQRYRLSRTLWCGIRGGMEGSALAYGWRSFLYTLLLPFTLFQTLPWMQVRLAERRINASRFGSVSFAFQGRASALYGTYLVTFLSVVLLYVLTVGGLWHVFAPLVAPLIRLAGQDPRVALALQGVIWIVFFVMLAMGLIASLLTCWYLASLSRHILSNTTFATLQLGSLITGRRRFGLMLGNLLITIFTLGLGLPIVTHRTARFLADNVLVTGTLDGAALQQSTLAMPRTGEGMLQMLDHGAML